MARTPYHSVALVRMRQAALERDAGRCCICGDRAVLVQHVEPISEGGAWAELANLQSLCLACAEERRWLPPIGGMVEPLDAA